MKSFSSRNKVLWWSVTLIHKVTSLQLLSSTLWSIWPSLSPLFLLYGPTLLFEITNRPSRIPAGSLFFPLVKFLKSRQTWKQCGGKRWRNCRVYPQELAKARLDRNLLKRDWLLERASLQTSRRDKYRLVLMKGRRSVPDFSVINQCHLGKSKAPISTPLCS